MNFLEEVVRTLFSYRKNTMCAVLKSLVTKGIVNELSTSWSKSLLPPQK